MPESYTFTPPATKAAEPAVAPPAEPVRTDKRNRVQSARAAETAEVEGVAQEQRKLAKEARKEKNKNKGKGKAKDKSSKKAFKKLLLKPVTLVISKEIILLIVQ